MTKQRTGPILFSQGLERLDRYQRRIHLNRSGIDTARHIPNNEHCG
jgi:hypothetical protein